MSRQSSLNYECGMFIITNSGIICVITERNQPIRGDHWYTVTNIITGRVTKVYQGNIDNGQTSLMCSDNTIYECVTNLRNACLNNKWL